MVRVKRGNVARKRRKKILKQAKGFRGSHSTIFKMANQQVMKSLVYAYRGRKEKKRKFRQLWITRINAAARANQTKYSEMMHSLKKAKVILNRKMLSHLALTDPRTFSLLANFYKVGKLDTSN